MGKKRLVYLCLAAVCCLTIGGCSGISVQDDNEPIKIGVIGALSGPNSVVGDPAAKALAIGEEEINLNGGIKDRQIQLIFEDGACDTKTAINAANKLINIDNASIILGGHCSTESMAIAPLANNNSVIQIASMTSADAYTDAGDYSFRNWPNSDYFIGKLAEISYKRYDARQIAIVYEQNEFSLSVYKSFKKKFEEMDGKVIKVLTFPVSETDFNTYLLEINSADNIDSILFSSQGPNTSIPFLKTLKQMGMIDKYKLFGNGGPVNKEVFNETKGLNANMITVNAYVDPQNKLTKNFLEKYKQKYNQYPPLNNFYAASSYDALMIIKDAINNCDGDEHNKECIKKFLYNLKNWQGAAGQLSFDSNGDGITSLRINYFDEQGNEVWEEIE